MALSGDRVLALFALVLMVTACSGASEQDLFASTPGQASQTNTSPTEPAPSPAKPDPTDDAAPPIVKDGGADAAPELPTCTPEVEPNNDNGRATKIATDFCGKIDVEDDVDFANFVAPAGATSMTITHEEKGGKLAYRVNGSLLTAQAETMKAVPGVIYKLQIKVPVGGSDDDRPTYVVNVSFGK